MVSFTLKAFFFFNPNIKIIQFNPFTKSLILLGFKFIETTNEREFVIEKAIFFSKHYNFIFGTLGRQGNMKILRVLAYMSIQKKMNCHTYAATEINNYRLNTLNGDLSHLWVQLSCPRLSLDWGSYFKNLLLTPFELGVLVKNSKIFRNHIPMDFYSKTGKFWSNYSVPNIKFLLNRPKKKYLVPEKYKYFRNFILKY